MTDQPAEDLPTQDFRSDDPLQQSEGSSNGQSDIQSQDDAVESDSGPKASLKKEQSALPKTFGRYRIVSLLGTGGFGQVYRATDEQLQRNVAIKVTKAELLDDKLRQNFLTEARIVAGLDHPHIVPVYDVGQTDDGDFFVVSKLIDGSDLATRIKLELPDRLLSLRIVSAIAEALQYAHSKGLVHRDVKPANILIDRSDRPYLTDFGLALRESEFGKQAGYMGTPAYMSPEQARGEGHRVDNRSDIYSLGVVMYELLTGRRPFRSDSARELMSLIASEEARSPRLFDDSISVDMERICLKALARRASDRFTVARDFAEEINWLLANQAPTPGHIPATLQSPTPLHPPSSTHPPSPTTLHPTPSTHPTGPTRVVPKGLRSFDAGDADFFLELLPGPFDRGGLPEGIRFWKTKIEETDPERTFKVGLIYGPSGCGKSSLMKAGLMPRLGRKIIPIYLEATPDDTDYRLLRAVRKAIPEAEGGSLKEVLSVIRRRKLVPTGGKLLLVLDQFEQWLYAEADYARASLTEALLQCDGGAIQAIIMVREDFWISVSRFLRELEIPILEQENSSMVDLFDLDHAAKVLGLFGKAYGKLPDSSKDWTADQHEFIRQAVEGLSQERKVISVRLAVFADMMKSRSWTTAALREVGGIEGIGVTFLEETFGSKHAPIQHRQHQNAVRGLLAALLPTTGSDIKGVMRSSDELRTAAGYDRHPRDFQDLMGILDKNLRLITPVDPEESEKLEVGSEKSEVGMEKFEVGSLKCEKDTASNLSNFKLQTSHFILSHDYLVPSLREWLTRKQRETKKGRAELKLAERAATWSANPENKQLPSIIEWFQIRWHTASSRWTEPQRKMMQKAGKVHGLTWGGTIAALLAVSVAIQSWVSQRDWASKQQQTQLATESLQNNLGSSIPLAIQALQKLPERLVLDELQSRFASDNPRHKLAVAFALAAYGQVETEYLVSRIDDIAPTDSANFVDALSRDRERAVQILKAEALQCNSAALWRRKAKIAIAALALGETEIAADMCQYENRPDPGQRTIFINEFPRWEWYLPERRINLSQLAELVSESDHSGLRSGLCLAVGSIPLDQLQELNPSGLVSWHQLVSRWHTDHGDTSTHSASSWLLRQWQLPIPAAPDQDRIQPDRDWFVNSVGMTMLRIQTPPSAAEQAFWIASCEVTRGQFEAFVNDQEYSFEKPTNWRTVDTDISPTADHPAQNVSLYDAVMYCNWLSRREGKTPAYRKTGEQEKGDYDENLYDQWELVADATGYRLPWEVEWEYAARAGSQTDWSSGSDEGLLADYCQMYPSKRSALVGQKLPNAWGLQDMHGNVWEWCNDLWGSADSFRVPRGGSWRNDAASSRSAYRSFVASPADRADNNGFRVALSSPSGIPQSAEPGTDQ